MNQDVVVSLAMDAMQLALKVALPLLLVGLVIGFLISIFQAVTQIQEMTLTFIPKIIATGLVIAVAGPWMLGELISYTERLYSSIPELIGP
jgi:flagellar biosynthesis protein FliQ